MKSNPLVSEWQSTFQCPAPVGAHASLLKQAIGWHNQAKRLGGLTAKEQKLLLGNSGLTPTSVAKVSTGSHLIRVWQGETHQVTVLEVGYMFAGRQWRSLSAIAKYITGTPWSGPVFFGIKK